MSELLIIEQAVNAMKLQWSESNESITYDFIPQENPMIK